LGEKISEADVDARTKYGGGSLLSSASHGNPENITALIAASVDVDARDYTGCPPSTLQYNLK
jgi:ankyrin repeat protein